MIKNKKKGFTLIEIIVFTGIMGVMMVGLVGVLLNSLKARNRSRLEDLVDFNGNWIGEQVRWNLMNATYGSVVCTSNTVTLDNKKDNNQTVLGCDSGKIASSSGTVKYYLSGEEVADSCGITGQDLAVNCSTDLVGNVYQVEVDYQVTNRGSGVNWDDKVIKDFETKVVIRQ